MSHFISPRFVSWLAIGVAAAFLVVATVAFSLSASAWLAFAIGLGTLVVSAGLSLTYRRSAPTLVTGALTALVSAWTVVASLVFSLATVHDLALAGALAIVGLAIVGVTAHEVSTERAGAQRAVRYIPTGRCATCRAVHLPPGARRDWVRGATRAGRGEQHANSQTRRPTDRCSKT